MPNFRDAQNTTWKIWNNLFRWIAYPRIRLIFAIHGIAWGENWRIYGVPIIQKHKQSSMVFKSGLSLRSSPRSNPISPNHPVVLCTWQAGSHLSLGENFAMTGGTLCAVDSIEIGDRVIVGANVMIADTDFHPINPTSRIHQPNAGNTKPVIIGNDVFIGTNSIILKGTTIGSNSVIGAGSIVSKNIPSNVIAAGNPAEVIKEIDPSS